MKTKSAFFAFILLLSCQGPWSYWPEDTENYKGIWVSAYVVSGRPVSDVCFDKLHALDEVRMPGFAFYEMASVKIAGTFDMISFYGSESYEIDTSFFLQPPTFNYYNHGYNPNCFQGPSNLLAASGKNYEIDISIVWDSAGEKVTSNLHAKTSIPQKFKIKKAYNLEGKQATLYCENYFEDEFCFYEFLYLPPPMDTKASYFIPEYSDDVAGVQVTMVYNSSVYWGENFMDQIIEQFNPDEYKEGGLDASIHVKFSDRNQVYFARNLEIAGQKKDIDSIPVLGLAMPAVGNFKLLFYAVTNEYVKYLNTHTNGASDSRVQPFYNISGGAGIFAGMVVDTFDIHIGTLNDVRIYSYRDAQIDFCFGTEMALNGKWQCRLTKYKQCVDFWDYAIGEKINNPVNYGTYCDHIGFYSASNLLLSEDVKRYLTENELIRWCEYKDFPITRYPVCGSAMVKFYKNGAKSSVLEREVKKWCKNHEDDAECSFLYSQNL